MLQEQHGHPFLMGLFLLILVCVLLNARRVGESPAHFGFGVCVCVCVIVCVQKRMFRHLVRMSSLGRHSEYVPWRSRGGPRTHWSDYISWLAWEGLDVPLRTGGCGWGEGKLGFLGCPCDQDPDKWNTMVYFS